MNQLQKLSVADRRTEPDYRYVSIFKSAVAGAADLYTVLVSTEKNLL